ncbi:hypothetical protein NLU13_6959 [Sarocladium strictum]|uniref:DUF7730 domain-containing protein n=1 Tax=Sarocladium strictum TaxID=5046 RepID=A0AA39GGQ1_SARSR|nr:hypothetical protein NLU13_6959 [Sarocladium strictum]
MTLLRTIPPIVSSNRGSLVQRAKRFVFGDPKPITPNSERDNPQLSVLLLHRLPFEIRSQIWNAYFYSPATVKVHIVGYATQAAECLVEDQQSFHPKSHLECHRLKQKRDRLNLLLTCKRIYFECAPLLYETTMFDFSSTLYTISNFRKLIPAHHFACISQVSILILATWKTLAAPADKENENGQTRQWPLIWETLAAMTNLRWLRFEVRLVSYDSYVGVWVKNMDEALRPVKMVTKPSHFELILPFDVGDWARELPCQVVRSENKDAWK